MTLYWPVTNPDLEKLKREAARRQAARQGVRPTPVPTPTPTAGAQPPPPFFQTFEEQQAAFAPTAGMRQEAFRDILAGQADMRRRIAGIQEKTRPIAGVIPGGTPFESWSETWNLPITLMGGTFIDAFNRLVGRPVPESEGFLDIIGTIKRQQQRGTAARLASELISPFEAGAALAGAKLGARAVGSVAQKVAASETGRRVAEAAGRAGTVARPRVALAGAEIPDDLAALMSDVAAQEGRLVPDLESEAFELLGRGEYPDPVIQARYNRDVAKWELDASREVTGEKAPAFGTTERSDWEARRMQLSYGGTPVLNKKRQIEQSLRKLERTEYDLAMAEAAEEIAKEPWQMVRAEWEAAKSLKRRQAIEAWNRAGSKGFPPSSGLDTVAERTALGEKVGYQFPRDTELVMRMDSHRLRVEVAMAEGKPVPTEVLADYPDLVRQAAPPAMAPRISVQGGMGIGEAPQQVGMEIRGRGAPAAPLIPPEGVAAQAERARLLREGQEALPEGALVGPSGVTHEKRVILATRGGYGSPYETSVPVVGGRYSIRHNARRGGTPAIGPKFWVVVDDATDPFLVDPTLISKFPANEPGSLGLIIPGGENYKVLKGGFTTQKEAVEYAKNLLKQQEVLPEAALPNLARAKTGEPFSSQMFRGSGRPARESVFDPHFAQENIFGEATYVTPKREFAETFGPEVSEVVVSLRNPLVIDTDRQWLALTREAGWLSFAPSDAADVQRMRKLIVDKGHDGVIIRVPESEQVGKRLQGAFGDDTVVDFNQVFAKPPEAAPARAPMAVRPELDDVTRSAFAALVQDVDQQLFERLHGIEWAAGTGRLSAKVETQLRKATNTEWLRLAEQMPEGTTMNDVPGWLNARLEVPEAPVLPVLKEGAAEITPPTVPPQPPAAPPSVRPPVGPEPEIPSAPAITDALNKAELFEAIDAPGAVGRFLDKVPGVSQLQSYLRPANKLVPEVRTAHNARHSEQAVLGSRWGATRQTYFSRLSNLFGRGAVAGNKTSIRFTGSEAERNPFTGTLLDIAQRPQLYDLTLEQSQLLVEWQARNADVFAQWVDGYGLAGKVGEFQVPEGSVFLRNVDKNEDLLDLMQTTEMRQAMRGGMKTRIFETAADRWKENPTFVPVTDIRILQTAMDESKIYVAGREIFKEGSGGKTLVEVVDETHPGLREARDTLAQTIRSLRGQLDTAERRERLGIAEVRKTATQVRRIQKRAEPMLEKIDDLAEEWGPELSFLSGQTRELHLQAAALERRGLVITGRVGKQAGKAQGLRTQVGALVPELDRIRKEYKAANLRGYELVSEGIFRYYKGPAVRQVRELQQRSNSHLVRLLEGLRQTTFAGDISPLMGVQLPLFALFNPKLTATRFLGAVRNAAREKNLLRSFQSDTMAKAIRENPQLYEDWSFWSGIPIGTTEKEFAVGLWRFVPGFTKVNEAMFTLVTRQAVAMYEKNLLWLVKSGITGDAAHLVAADVSTKAIPMWNPARLGLSPARAAAIRSVPTSISFLTRPAALVGEATTGLAKLVTGQALKPQELLALKAVATFYGSTMALSVGSAVTSALLTGKDPWQAAMDAMNPVSGKFASITIGTRRIPLGGPYRAIIKAIAPRDVDWSSVPVPFANIGFFFKNRLGPALSTAVDEISNRTFHGEKIRKGKMPEQILRSLAYALEGTLPLTAGEVVSGLRRGIGGKEIVEEAVAQFAGTTLQRDTPFQERDADAANWARQQGIPGVGAWRDLSPSQKKAYEEASPGVTQNIKQEIARRAEQGIDTFVKRQRAEDLKVEYTQQQQADDAAMESGLLSPVDWRKRREDRSLILRSRRDELYEDLDEQDPKTPTDFYYAKLNELTAKAHGLMTEQTWAELDAWIAEQTPEDQLYIEENTRLGALTPTVQEYYDDQKTIEPYWEAEIRIKRKFSERWGRKWDEYLALSGAAAREFRQKNLGAIREMEKERDGLRFAMRKVRPGLERALLKWEYITKPMSEIMQEKLISEQERRIREGRRPLVGVR